MNIENKNIVSTLYDSIKNIIEQSKHYSVTQVNYSLVIAYWNIGKMIKENIIENKRAEYGEETIKKLGEKLTLEYGNGFGQRNLFRMMKFYEFFPDTTILTTLSAKFSWSHFVELNKGDIVKQQSDFILYTGNDGKVNIDVFVQDENVWLTQKAMGLLFGVESHTITYHLKEIFKSDELDKNATTRKIRVVQKSN